LKGRETGPDDPACGVAGTAARLPCLFSNNSTYPRKKPSKEEIEKKINCLTGNHRKTAEALRQNVQMMADKYGIHRIGFLTLTTPDEVTPKEYQRRFNSLRSHVLHERYGDRIKIVERGSKSGRFHGHLLVVLPFDIRTGCNFEEFAQGNYSSAPQALRDEWAFLRETLPQYNFGRHELLPVKSTAEGIAFYVGKYVSKHVDGRIESDKGVRLVEYGKGARNWNSRFAWHTPKARLWRAKLASVGAVMGVHHSDGLGKVLGRRWAYKFRFIFRRIKLDPEKYPDDPMDWPREFVEEVQRLINTGQRIFLTPEDACTEIGLMIHRQPNPFMPA
jgi:hypothetical protein